MLNKWSNYGKAFHPLIWWECVLLQYIRVIEPDKLTLNPKVIEVTPNLIKFQLDVKTEVFSITKKKIIETLYPDSN